MKRLHSNLKYPYVLSPIVFDVFISYELIITSDFSFKLVFLLLLINAIFIGWLVAIVSDLKRVYVKDNTMYFYDLYSTTPYIISLKQLREFERDNSRDYLLLGIYKATFLIEDGSLYDVKFMKSKLIWNIRKYI